MLPEEEKTGTRLHISVLVNYDYAEHSPSGLVFLDGNFPCPCRKLNLAGN